ncbi:MAG: DsbA family protein [Nannocystaceae bacterium]|nr:DsbA family protein [Nannocystaceae bacterium]
MFGASQPTRAAETRPLMAFGDFNCPFCYALEERLTTRTVDARVEWRLVEHAPELPATLEAATQEEQRELDQELDALLTRAPEVLIRRPPFRPRSGPAIRALIATSHIDPDVADQLRLALFRALWLEGRNIADEEVLADLAFVCGLREPLDGSAYAAAAAQWTAQWRAAELNRIPCLISRTDAKLLGLSTTERLDLFLRSGLFGSQTDDACTMPDP